MTTKEFLFATCGVFFATTVFSQHRGEHGHRGHNERHETYRSSHHDYDRHDRHEPVARYHHTPRVGIYIAPRPIICRQQTVYVQQNVCNQALEMSQDNFYNLKRTVIAIRYEDDRLSFLLDRIENNYFTSNQIADLMYCFASDQNRLAIARYAYAKVVDPDRYSLTYNALQYQENVKQLDIYINGNAQYSSRR